VHSMLVEKVRKYMEDRGMLSRGDRVVVGLSGGPDSVALLHILRELQESMEIRLFAAHVNHCLRGGASDEDAAFAERLCREWDIPFFQKRADIGALSARFHRSEEETGRLVRYDFFRQVRKQVNGNRIATAHHRNDQAETILHHIIRGAGMQGLSGIAPVSEGVLIRPLLDVTREEIRDYLRENKLSCRVDATNADSYHTRNRIRNGLIPYLERDFNPDIVGSLARMGEIVREENDFMAEYCGRVYRECSSREQGAVDLDLEQLLSFHSAVQKRLIQTAILEVRGSPDGVGSVHILAAARLALQSRTGSVTRIPSVCGPPFHPEVIVEKGYGVLRFRKSGQENTPAFFDVPLPVPGTVFLKELGILVTAEETDVKRGFAFSPECIYMDESAVKGSLRIRLRRNGDRFRPLGLNGTKKLKDFFMDRKIPREERDRIPLLIDREDGKDHIIWVVGLQMSGDYRITESSGRILRIGMKYKNLEKHMEGNQCRRMWKEY